MRILVAVLVVSASSLHLTLGFQTPRRIVPFPSASSVDDDNMLSSSTTALEMAKSRKARRMQNVEKQGKSRPNAFYDAIADANDEPVEGGTKKTGKKKKKGKKGKKRMQQQQAAQAVATEEKQQQEDEPVSSSPADAAREARAREAQERMDQRPEVSTMIVDEETGIEVVAQGKSVMDVVTRKAVVLSSLGPEYRLAQMFPGVPPAVRDAHRLDWATAQVPDMVERLRAACSVDGEIPPHPSVANKAIDFVLANRDYLGHRMKRTLGRLQLSAMSNGNAEEAREYQKLWKNFMTLENHISAPFRQMVMDAEGRVGPNFGNLDLTSFANGHLYERCANYLVLKGMVAHWEKKVVDAEYVEKTPQTKENYMTVLARGDPKRYLPDPPILFTLKECTQVCYMSQQMTKAFVETPELFDDLPPEIRFLEAALSIKGGTTLRQFMMEEFCPAEGITPAALREGLRRLYAQLENMQIDPYADICNLMQRLIGAMAVGATDEERDPYTSYLANKDPTKGPAGFQTYTFNHEQLSLVRFLDGQYESAGTASMGSVSGGGGGGSIGGGMGGGGGLGDLFNFGAPAPAPKKEKVAAPPAAEEEVYKVPKERAAGRPHELGWLDLLKSDEKDENLRLGKVPPGTIIPDE